MLSRRLTRERRTVLAMIRLYCRDHHKTQGSLCPQCDGLRDYVQRRLDRCVFGGKKPTCAKCPVHCYAPDPRKQIKVVMRYAGPRMPLRHPFLALAHVIDGRRKAPSLPQC